MDSHVPVTGETVISAVAISKILTLLSINFILDKKNDHITTLSLGFSHMQFENNLSTGGNANHPHLYYILIVSQKC